MLRNDDSVRAGEILGSTSEGAMAVYIMTKCMKFDKRVAWHSRYGTPEFVSPPKSRCNNNNERHVLPCVNQVQ